MSDRVTTSPREWCAFDDLAGQWTIPCACPLMALMETDNDIFETTRFGWVERFKPTVDAAVVLDSLENDAYVFADDHAEYWAESISHDAAAVSELGDMLQAALAKWIEKHELQPDFYLIHEVELQGEER